MTVWLIWQFALPYTVYLKRVMSTCFPKLKFISVSLSIWLGWCHDASDKSGYVYPRPIEEVLSLSRNQSVNGVIQLSFTPVFPKLKCICICVCLDPSFIHAVQLVQCGPRQFLINYEAGDACKQNNNNMLKIMLIKVYISVHFNSWERLFTGKLLFTHHSKRAMTLHKTSSQVLA